TRSKRDWSSDVCSSDLIHQPEDFENFNYPAFLNFKTKDLSEDTLLLAFNGWYDYSFAPQLETKEIQRKKQIYWYDRWINRRKTEIGRASCREGWKRKKA